MQPNQSTTVDSVQNKELLWTTLQESGAFTGLPSDRFQHVYAAFEKSVQQASKSVSGSLSDVNKHIIRQFVQTDLPVLRLSATNAVAAAPKKKKIEMVYRAEDLQNERASEFDRQMREKQAEMDSFLTLKKPTDVNFADAGIKDDKPIGDEMSRLIAQELAARERELVQMKPEDIKRAQQWIGTTTDNNANNAIKTELPLTNNSAKKSVSFSNTNMMNVVEEEEQYEPNENTNNEFMNGENFEETDILSKFKRISEPLLTESVSSESITMQQLCNKMIELEKIINANHAEIMAHLKRGVN